MLERNTEYELNPKENINPRIILGDRTLDILEKKYIGGGDFGNVYKVLVMYLGRKLSFAIKEFNQSDSFEHSIEMYKHTKKVGLPTWTTYEKIDAEKSILMTLGTMNGDLFASPFNNSESLDIYRNMDLQVLLSGVIEPGLDCCFIAAKAGLIYIDDAYFLHTSSKGSTNLILGDFDQSFYGLETSKINLFMTNVLHFKQFLSARGHPVDEKMIDAKMDRILSMFYED